jgi:hypothetical protein
VFLTRTGLIILTATFAHVAFAGVAFADHAREYNFTVLRNGSPIGYHRVTLNPEGDRLEVEATTELKLKWGPITIFRFDHERREVWEGRQLLGLASKTNDNGKHYEIAIKPDGEGYIRTVNGRIDKFDDSTKVLSLRDKSTLKNGNFISPVEDKIFSIDFEYVGKDYLWIGDEEADVDYYKITGEIERQLWYDALGHVVKVQFKRLGSDIQYILDEGVASLPKALPQTFNTK